MVLYRLLTQLAALFRPSELVLLGYFLYAAGVGLARPIDASIQRTAISMNLSIMAAYCLLAWVDSFRRRRFFSILRDWMPLPLMLLAYREMGWFALPHTSTALEESWVVWDRLLLDQWGLRALVESAGWFGPALLELAYSLVYVMGPISLAALYLAGGRKHADRFLFLFLLSVLVSDALFPLFPSEPPRTVFPGQDLPAVETLMRRFNLWYLGELGIHMSVFPSAHVSGAFGAAFGLMWLVPGKPWLGRAMLALAVLIATATVYGRYHYVVDALAGLAVSLLARRIALRFYGRGARGR